LVASQKITDKISISGANKIKRIEAKIFKKSGRLRFKNNHSALIFDSFHQGKEQRFLFQMKRSYYFTKPYLQKEKFGACQQTDPEFNY
jgi:hypothetical protein